MWRRSAWALLSAAVCLVSGKASAGPVELLNQLSISPADSSNLVLYYQYGGNGIFVSQDGGKTMSWMCSAGVAPAASNRNAVVHSGGDGSIYVGLFDGLLRGDANGCNFVPVPELDMKYIATITGDPIDPKRTYLATTNAMADNGIYMNDGSGTFAAFGSQAQLFIDTLDVVKNGDARRFYETGVLTNADTNEVTYSVRVSDDDAMTWTDEPYDLAQFGPMDMYAEFSIIAIDPTNPDHIIGKVSRRQSLDTLVESSEMGKSGSWTLLAEPTEVGAAAYTPEGVLYFSDSDQKTKAMYVVEKPGDMPKMLTDNMRVTCLGYDATNMRLLGCSNNYHFGSFDLATGELTPMLDLRCAENAVECADAPEKLDKCAPPGVEFCKEDHWVLAPMCNRFERSQDCATYASMQTFGCVDGFAVSKDDAGDPIPGAAPTCASATMNTTNMSSAGASGAATPAAGSGTQPSAGTGSAGTSASGSASAGNGSSSSAAGSGTSTDPTPPTDANSGCGCSTLGSSQTRLGAPLGLTLGLLGLFWRARRRQARRS